MWALLIIATLFGWTGASAGRALTLWRHNLAGAPLLAGCHYRVDVAPVMGFDRVNRSMVLCWQVATPEATVNH